jgi:DNA-binding LacI/PurR family transcriptional regulator
MICQACFGWCMTAPTIHTVAAAAGVATSTVSRALSNPNRVSAATRLRVEQVARELGYVPHARASASMRTRAVAVVVADIANPFYFDLIRGAGRQLRAAAYSQLLVDAEESGDLEADLIERMRPQFDGLILAASRLSDRAITKLAERVPIVIINRTVPRVPSVVVDTAFGMTLALEHLVSLGHREIAYVAGPDRSWANALRWRALTTAGERHGVSLSRVGPFGPHRAMGSAAADAVLNSGATACIAYNDLLAIGMLERFGERGVSVPGDMSVVGCDDIFGADFCNPTLTTVTAPIDQAGRVAATLLLAALESPGSSRREGVVLPTHLTVRNSTGAPA